MSRLAFLLTKEIVNFRRTTVMQSARSTRNGVLKSTTTKYMSGSTLHWIKKPSRTHRMSRRPFWIYLKAMHVLRDGIARLFPETKYGDNWKNDLWALPINYIAPSTLVCSFASQITLTLAAVESPRSTEPWIESCCGCVFQKNLACEVCPEVLLRRVYLFV
jgi:hypothetical protein